MSFSIRGSKAMQKRLDKIAKQYPDEMERALRIEAELVMTDSKNNYVPVEYGTLRSSGTVHDVERKGKEISVSMSYGGAASAYALTVHEHPSSFDPPSWEAAGEVNFKPRGRGPKYLEMPLREAVKGMAQRIAQRLGVEKVADGQGGHGGD